MNRKDTILVAVLINAGVLVVLFTSALKNKQVDQYVQHKEETVVLEPKLEPVSIMKDEIDLAIEQAKKQETISQEVPKTAQEIVFDQNSEPLAVQSEKSSMQEVMQTTLVDVTVKKGDFLAKIAKRHNVTVEEIMKINHLKNTNLRIGQVLKIPQYTKVVTATEVVQKPVEIESGKIYTIKPGDNPWTIAQKHKMKVDELLKINNLTPEKAKHLKVGDKLKVK